MNFLFAVQYILALFILSFTLAKLEINIEGKNGWAKNLPTWRKKNKYTRLIYGNQILTGYHFWLNMFLLAVLHYPFLLLVSWSLKGELTVLSLLYFIWVIEDFLWFVLNPDYGIKKFNKESIPWHIDWLWKFPKYYYPSLALGSILLALSSWL